MIHTHQKLLWVYRRLFSNIKTIKKVSRAFWWCYCSMGTVPLCCALMHCTQCAMCHKSCLPVKLFAFKYSCNSWKLFSWVASQWKIYFPSLGILCVWQLWPRNCVYMVYNIRPALGKSLHFWHIETCNFFFCCTAAVLSSEVWIPSPSTAFPRNFIFAFKINHTSII